MQKKIIKQTDNKSEFKENEFLKYEYKEVKLESLGLEGIITDILNQKIE